MRRVTPYLFFAILASTPCLETRIFADADSIPEETQQVETPQTTVEETKEVAKAPERIKKQIPAFTGKITKNRVRMRIQPSLDSPILKELNNGDLLIIDGEVDDFYSVKAPQDLKAYVFRTFILDGAVEGTRVNVRLEPTLDSPIIAQLNSGDRVKGMISPLNSKWMEIQTPETTRFYVAKDFVENIGGPNKLAEISKRKEEVEKLYNDAYAMSHVEMQKDFENIQLDGINANLNKVITTYTDFPDFAEKSKSLMSTLQDSYTKKKLAYLEAAAQKNNQTLQAKTQELQQKEQLLTQMQFIKSNTEEAPLSSNSSPTAKMAAWALAEQAAYEQWAQEQTAPSLEEFYRQEEQQAIVLKGILENYTKTVKNKPGDFVLINPANHLPIAYLYSTQVNLQDKVGQQITVRGTERPNNNFAFKAYYVLSVE